MKALTTRKLMIILMTALLFVALSLATIVTFGNNATTADNADVAIAGSNDNSASVNTGIATAASTSTDHTWEHTGKNVVSASGGTLQGGSSASNPTYYYLNSNVELTKDITISGYVELCLNGYMLKGTGKDAVIWLGSDANFTLHDCCKGKSCGTQAHQHVISGDTIYGGVITGGRSPNGGGLHVSDASFTMNGGTITGNTATSEDNGGGGVSVFDSTFTMTGGTITKNDADWSGGGVFVGSSSEVIMSGGAVSENTAKHGGGVRIDYGTFTMSGGTISDNVATSNAGGVFVSGTFTMSGGTISGNKAGSGFTAGVYVNGTFNVSGVVKIYENKTSTDSTDINVNFKSAAFKINITGALTDGNGNNASIGVSHPSSKATLTSGYSTHNKDVDPTTYFSADNGDWIFILDNEVYLSDEEPHYHSFEGPYINDGAKGHYQLCACTERQYSNHTTDNDDYKASINHDPDGHWLICKDCNEHYNEVTHEWNGQWQPGDGNHYQECEDCEQRYEQQHKWGDWEIDKVGSESVARTQKLTCDDCKDTQSRTLELMGIEVSADKEYNAKDTKLTNVEITAHFKVASGASVLMVASDLDEEVDSHVYTIGDYEITKFAKGNYLTADDTSVEVSYTIGGVTKTDTVQITVNKLEDTSDAIVGDYSREGWHEGQRASDETRPEVQATSYEFKYYTDDEYSVEYNGKFDESTPAGTYYVKLVVNDDPVYEDFEKELGSFTVTGHAYSGAYINDAEREEHYQKCTVVDDCESKEYSAHRMEYYTLDNDKHWEYCEDCNYNFDGSVDSEAHDVEWTESDNGVTHVGSCSECGNSNITGNCESNAKLVGDQSSHWYNCKVCDGKMSEELHNEGSWTLDQINDLQHHKVCNECGEVLADSEAEHEYTYSLNDDETHNAVCECGYSTTFEHIYNSEYVNDEAEDKHYQECTACGYKLYEEHSWSEWSSKDGDNHERACDKCEAVETEQHVWNDGVVTSDATASEDGVRTFTCEKCGATKTEPIPATGEVEIPADDTPSQDGDPASSEINKKVTFLFDKNMAWILILAGIGVLVFIILFAAKRKRS